MIVFNSAEIIYFFSVVWNKKKHHSFTSANVILHLQWNTQVFPTISPQPSKNGFCFPQPWKAIHSHSAAASKDISSFCKFFLGYFKDDCLSLLMIPTLNRLQSPLILYLLHPFYWKNYFWAICQTAFKCLLKILYLRSLKNGRQLQMLLIKVTMVTTLLSHASAAGCVYLLPLAIPLIANSNQEMVLPSLAAVSSAQRKQPPESSRAILPFPK